MDITRTYRIMIGAPSDMKKEVEIAKNIINHWNDINSNRENTVLLPLHWEVSAYPATGKHPQKIINEQVVAKSDMFIGIFGKKLGSPTENYLSGTVEEINEHLQCGKKVMMFFCSDRKNLGDVNQTQHKRLLTFKRQIVERALWVEFNGVQHFKTQLTDKLQLYLNDNWLKEKFTMDIPKGEVCKVRNVSEVVLKHDTLRPYDLIRNARREVIFHAAIYPKYIIESQYNTAVKSFLNKNREAHVTVLLSSMTAAWASEFGMALRCYETKSDYVNEVERSKTFFERLDSNRVSVGITESLPFVPMIIIDNHILLGHYCHSQHFAPEGIWIHLYCEKVPKMVAFLRSAGEARHSRELRDNYIKLLTEEEMAIFRYVEEVFYAIEKSTINPSDKNKLSVKRMTL